jgi:hypothetical protein
MSRRGFYKRGLPEPNYGLVPITSDGEIVGGERPTPLRVFQCNSCGVLALFPQDHERNPKSRDMTDELKRGTTVSPADRVLREQLRLRQQLEATASQAQQIFRERQSLEQQAKRR